MRKTPQKRLHFKHRSAERKMFVTLAFVTPCCKKTIVSSQFSLIDGKSKEEFQNEYPLPNLISCHLYYHRNSSTLTFFPSIALRCRLRGWNQSIFTSLPPRLHDVSPRLGFHLLIPWGIVLDPKVGQLLK